MASGSYHPCARPNAVRSRPCTCDAAAAWSVKPTAVVSVSHACAAPATNSNVSASRFTVGSLPRAGSLRNLARLHLARSRPSLASARSLGRPPELRVRALLDQTQDLERDVVAAALRCAALDEDDSAPPLIHVRHGEDVPLLARRPQRLVAELVFFLDAGELLEEALVLLAGAIRGQAPQAYGDVEGLLAAARLQVERVVRRARRLVGQARHVERAVE